RRSGERHVQRADSRATIDLESGVQWERLTPGPDHDMDFLFVTYDVGGSSSEGNRSLRRAGREYGLILSGTLEVTVGFDHYVLGPGDSISFDSTVPHNLTNRGDEPVRGIWVVVGRQDDRRRKFEPNPASEGQDSAGSRPASRRGLGSNVIRSSSPQPEPMQPSKSCWIVAVTCN